MVKYFWPLKDLHVLVEMLFVTVKNAVQSLNLQARNMCPRCQETAFQSFWTFNFYGVGPQSPYPVRASHLQCSQFWPSAMKPAHIYPMKLINKTWSIFLSICVSRRVTLPFLVIFLTMWIKSHFRDTFFKDILFKYRFELYDYSFTSRIIILYPCVLEEKVVGPMSRKY